MKASILDCLALLYSESTSGTTVKKNKIRKELKKLKNGDWSNYTQTLDVEWQWRIACAKLYLGELSWEGYQFRQIRDLLIPFDFKPWDGKTKVKNLLVFGEQGIGDEVMFASILPELYNYAENITVECRSRLVSIFQRSFPNIEFVGRKSFDDGEWAKDRDFDAQIPLGTLPKFFRTKRSQFPKEPYLLPDPERIKEVNEYLPKFHTRIGVSWKGRQAVLEEDFVQDVGFKVNLQYDAEAKDAFNPPIDLKDDMEGVFALISQLDKVVCVPTSVVHFAGSMGIPTTVVRARNFSSKASGAVDWRFSNAHNNGNRMLWHPSVQIYRNELAYIKSFRSKHANNQRVQGTKRTST